MITLQYELEKALEEEDYEKAAIIRDKIESLKKLYDDFFNQ